MTLICCISFTESLDLCPTELGLTLLGNDIVGLLLLLAHCHRL